MKNLLITIQILSALLTPATPLAVPLVMPIAQSQLEKYQYEVISTKVLSLKVRHPDKTVNDIFSDNILLNLHYIKGDINDLKTGKANAGENMINWEKIREPFDFSVTLKPDETFAFHDDVLPEFKDEKIISGWTEFSYNDGYKQVDGLYGNGVCHLASVLNWLGITSRLEVTAKVNHDFFPVKGVPQKYGTSILYMGGYSSQMQNLYIKNTYSHPITLVFNINPQRVVISVVKTTS